MRTFMATGSLVRLGVIFKVEAETIEEAAKLFDGGNFDYFDDIDAFAADCKIDIGSIKESD